MPVVPSLLRRVASGCPTGAPHLRVFFSTPLIVSVSLTRCVGTLLLLLSPKLYWLVDTDRS
jgi:hypothetical protein